MEKEREDKMKNKIGWCDRTFNPVWGCNNHCEYCYARGIAKRFGSVIAENEYYSHYWGNKRCAKGVNKTYIKNLGNELRSFIPTFLYGQYFKHFPKKPQRIFVGSMSEIYYWEKKWMEKVLNKIREYPQHTFQFLTKFPEVYEKYDFLDNCWLGVTIVNVIDSIEWIRFRMSYPNNVKFLCLEPLIRPAVTRDNSEVDLKGIDWVIIGAETGNRKGKVIPEKQWIWDIINYCQENNIPIYVKDSIIKLYSQSGGIKDFPEEKG